ncbi:MAG TPA: serine hydrolase, partial [Longimicrobiales bacterium]|nr:serine hydrolase [Longimicrobiales bacterium]
ADPQLISSAFEEVTGQTLEDVARERLLSPLGIEDFFWEKNVDGTPLGAHALFLRPRDLAKLGLLVLRRGVWEGTRLVSEDWIDQSTSTRTASDSPDFGYGYYWWIVPELDAYAAWGHGGQFIFVVPSQDLVISMTSLPSVDDDTVGTTLSRFLPLARLVSGSIR